MFDVNYHTMHYFILICSPQCLLQAVFEKIKILLQYSMSLFVCTHLFFILFKCHGIIGSFLQIQFSKLNVHVKLNLTVYAYFAQHNGKHIPWTEICIHVDLVPFVCFFDSF